MPPLYRDSTSCNLLSDRDKSSQCSNNTNTVTRVKCVLVGDGAIGKTSLIVSYTTNGYPTEYVPTAFDNYSVVVTIDNNPCQLQLCDTAGQDDFDTLRPLCYPQTNVFLLCFSVVCPTSFHNIQEKWLPEIKRYGNKAPIILVGTQCDLKHDVKVLIELAQCHEQPVNSEVARRVANKIGAIKYVECSALTQKNLKEVFDTAILTGIEYHQQLLQKSSAKSSSNLVTWGKAQGKKLLKNRCRDQNNTSTCSTSSSTSTSCSSGSNFSCNDTSSPPNPFPRKESTTANSVFSDAGAQQHLFCQHSSKNTNQTSNRNRLRKGWRKYCCGL